MNPLHTPSTIFDLELANPNPTSSKTKDGPVFRVSFELQRETWDWFMEAETKGMLLAAKACVVDLDGAETLETNIKPEKGPYGSASAILYRSGFHNAPGVREQLGGDRAYLAWVRLQPCCGRSEYHDGITEAAHVRRIAEGAGTGIKPVYSAVPLCQACHRLQHQQGESAVGGKDYLSKQAEQHVQAWAWAALSGLFNETSMTHVKPSQLAEWADINGLTWLIPTSYLEQTA